MSGETFYFSEFSEDDERHGLVQKAKTLLQKENVWSVYQSHESPFYGFSPESFSYLKNLNEESFVLCCKENFLDDLKHSKESERHEETKQIFSTQVKKNPDGSTSKSKRLSFDNSSNELSQSMTKSLEKPSSSVKIIQNATDPESLTKGFTSVAAKLHGVSQNVSLSQTQKPTSVKLIGSDTELENPPQKLIPVSKISEESQNASTSQTQQSTSLKLIGSDRKPELLTQDQTTISSLISDVSENVSTSGSMRSASVKVRDLTWTPTVLENKSYSKRYASIDDEKEKLSNESFTFLPKTCPSNTMTRPEIEKVHSEMLVYCIMQFNNLLKKRDNCLSYIYDSLYNLKKNLQLICYHIQNMVHFLHKISTLKGDYMSEKIQIYIFDTMCIASSLLLTLGTFRTWILLHIQFWVIKFGQIRKIHSNYKPIESHGKPLVSFETLQEYEKAIKSIWVYLDNEIDLAESMRLHFLKTEKDFVKFLNMFIESLLMVGIMKP